MQEIIDSFTYQSNAAAPNKAPIYLKVGTGGKTWVNNGPPGYALTFSNDCGGWTSASNKQYGSVWDFNATTGVTPVKDARIQPFLFTLKQFGFFLADDIEY